jgi:hypothetical protein
MKAVVDQRESPCRDVTSVTLRVPSHFRVQLVFRQEREKLVTIEKINGLSFRFCDGVMEYVPLLAEIRRTAGLIEALKGLVRSITPRRMFYCVLDEGRIVHSGWVTSSMCRHYYVERNAVVIGPIWSAQDIRGRGIATYATRLAINELVERGHRILYIDTSSDNYSCLRVIDKCGFGEPMTAYVHE